MQVLVLIALAQWVVDAWLYPICIDMLDSLAPDVTAAQELAVMLCCQLCTHG